MNGIGGRTIHEAKQRMPYEEFLAWKQYVEKRGTLNPGMRTEWLFARQALQINKAVGGKATFEHFMRYQDERIATLSDLARAIGLKPKEDT